MLHDDYYDSENWITRRKHQYKPRELWFPLSEAATSWEDEFHQLMLHDYIRMDAFQRAIRQVVWHLLKERSSSTAKPLRVLDIGTGYGILAFWAAEAARNFVETLKIQDRESPAIRVYAIEANPIVAGEAYKRLDAKGMLWKGKEQPGEIIVLNTSSYQLPSALAENSAMLKLFDPCLWETDKVNKSFKDFDLIISETLGAIGDNEDMVAILDHAIAAFLREDGVVIPSRIISFLVPIESTPSSAHPIGRDGEKNLSLHQAVAQGQYERISTHYELQKPSDPFNQFYDAIIPCTDYLSEKKPIHKWCFEESEKARKTLVVDYIQDIEFPVKKSGLFAGFKGFFKAILAEEKTGNQEIYLDIEGDDIAGRKTADCWKHLYVPIRQQIPVDVGDRILVYFERQTAPDGPKLTYRWKGSVETRDGRSVQFRQQHFMGAPYVPDHPPRALLDFIQRLATGLEFIHQKQIILPTTDSELVANFRSILWDPFMGSFLTQVGTPEQRPPSTEPWLTESMEERFTESLARLRIKDWVVGFPSEERHGELVWVRSDRELPSHEPPPVRNNDWVVMYEVNPDFNLDPENPDSFLSVKVRQYDQESLNRILSHTSEETGRPLGFCAYACVPHSVLSTGGIVAGELKRVWEAVNIAIFLAILIRHNRRLQTSQFSHQAAGLVAEVWVDKNKKQLELQSQACLWHLKTLIDLWDRRSLGPDVSICEGYDADFPEWRSLADEDFLNELIAISLSHALRRATFRPPKGDSVGEKTRMEARKIKDAPELRQQLGLTLRAKVLPPWVKTKGFVLCFHHCLWQSAYHAFRAICNDRPEPFLWIEFTGDQASIINRAEDSSHNQTQELTVDRQFFNHLQQRLEGKFRIEGPLREEDIWRTTILRG